MSTRTAALPLLIAALALALAAGAARAERPVVIAARTVGSGTGSVSAVRVEFDQAVLKASCHSPSFGLTEAMGVEALTFPPDQAAGDTATAVTLLVAQNTRQPRLDTSLAPLLGVETIDEFGVPTNADGERLNTGADDAPFQVEDGAPPVLVAVSGVPGADLLTLHFSEAVRRAGGGPFTAADFKVVVQRGEEKVQLTLSEMVNPNGADGELVVRLAAPVLVADMDAAKTDPQAFCVEIPGGTVQDAAGNVSPDFVAPVATYGGPYLRAAETRDRAGDGRVDEIRLEFSEPVDDTSFDRGLADVTVRGYNVTGFRTGVASNDNEVFVQLQKGGKPDTDATPVVSIRYGELLDASGRHLPDSGDMVAADRALPCVLDVFGVEGNDTLLVFFSEPVGPASAGHFDPADGPAELLAADDLHYVDGGSGVSGLAGVEADLGRLSTVHGNYCGYVFKVRAAAPLSRQDLEGMATDPDRLGAAAARIHDAAGNSAPAAITAMVRRNPDAPPPAPVSPPDKDGDADGGDTDADGGDTDADGGDAGGGTGGGDGTGGGTDTETRTSGDSSSKVAAGLGAGMAVLLVVIVAMVCFIRRRRSDQDANKPANADEAMDRWDRNRDGVLDRREVEVMLGNGNETIDGADTGYAPPAGYAAAGGVVPGDSDADSDAEELP